MTAAALAPLTTFLSVLLLWLWITSARANPVRERLDRIAPAEYVLHAGPRGSFWRRIVRPFLASISQLAAATAPRRSQQRLRDLLEQAGRPLSASALLAIRALLVVGLPGMYLLLLVAAHRPLSLISVLVLIVLPLVGSTLPRRWLVRRASARRLAIERALPDALDLIVVSMEAGLALDGAIAKLVEKSSGPLRDELAHMLQDVRLGKPRREAMRDMAKRADVKDLASVVHAIVQADQMGVSMGEVMRAEAQEARLRRRQKASELAHQAAVKMLFPLVLCILPSVMIVTIGPAALQIYHQMSKGLGI
ncbi:MAG: type II secretion system F family protein [Chloroflexi bacterium]|nr:type II secretion system F family protein [Chloroflexota bacterium]